MSRVSNRLFDRHLPLCQPSRYVYLQLCQKFVRNRVPVQAEDLRCGRCSPAGSINKWLCALAVESANLAFGVTVVT